MSRSQDEYDSDQESESGEITYFVKFIVTGYDHCGYCTDENTLGREPFLRLKKLVRVNRRVKKLRELDFREDGCTSGGSGYCDGFYQQYTAIRVLSTTPPSSPEELRAINRGGKKRAMNLVMSEDEDADSESE